MSARVTLAVAALLMVLLIAWPKDASAQDKPIVSVPLSSGFFTATRDKASATATLAGFFYKFFGEVDLTAATGNGDDIVIATRQGFAPGLGLKVSVQYDSRHDLLNRPGLFSQRALDYCQEVLKKTACTSEDFEAAHKELALSPIPSIQDIFWSAGLTAQIHYDQVTAYRNVADAQTANLSQVDVAVGATGTLYFKRAFALKLESGYVYAYDPDVLPIRRCTSVPSSDVLITAQSCSDTNLVLAKTEHQHSGFVHASLLYLAPHAKSEHMPGAEVAVFAESLGVAPHFDARASLFISPTRGKSIYTRTGVGLEVSTALSDASDGSYRAGHILGITPFAFIGANY